MSDGPASRPDRRDAWALLALTLLLAFFFFPVLFGGRIFFERDIHAVWWSQTESFVRCVASGSWPLWDPYIGFGQPMLANPSAQVAYPPTWLNLLIPLGPSYTLYVVGHLLLAGVGQYALGRQLGTSRAASLLASGLFVLSGPVLSLVSLWHHLAGACWIPWVLLTADRTLRHPTLRRTLVWAAVWAMQLLAGSADMCAMTGLLIAARAPTLVSPVDLLAPAHRRRLAAGVAAFVLAIGLSAVQWWPTAEIARRSARWSLAEAERAFWSLHPLLTVQTLLPALPTDLTLSDAARERLFEAREPFLQSTYLGLVALPLVLLSLAGPRRSLARGLVILVLGALVVALGRYTPIYDLLALVPPVRMLRYPVKALVVVAFGWSLLAGLGLDTLRGHVGPLPRRVPLAGLAGGAFALVAAFVAHRADAWAVPWVDLPPAASSAAGALVPVAGRLAIAGSLALLMGLLAVAFGAGLNSSRAAAAAGILVLADLALAHHRLNPTAPPALLAPPPILSAIRKPNARLHVFDYAGRILGRAYRRPARDFFRATWESRTSPLVRAAGTQGYLDPPNGRRFGLYGSYDQDLLSLAPPYLRNLTLLLRANEETAGYHRLLRLGSVDYVVALHDAGLEDLVPEGRFPSPFGEPIRLYRVPDPLPRVNLVSGARVARSTAAYHTLVDPSFDPGAEVVLESDRAAPVAAAFRAASGPGELRHDRVRVSVRLDRPGYLVLADAYDPGWRATLDGRPVEILRANVGFRATAVPAGDHAVEFLYRPPSVVAGFAVSAASWLVLLILACRASLA